VPAPQGSRGFVAARPPDWMGRPPAPHAPESRVSVLARREKTQQTSHGAAIRCTCDRPDEPQRCKGLFCFLFHTLDAFATKKGSHTQHDQSDGVGGDVDAARGPEACGKPYERNLVQLL